MPRKGRGGGQKGGGKKGGGKKGKAGKRRRDDSDEEDAADFADAVSYVAVQGALEQVATPLRCMCG